MVFSASPSHTPDATILLMPYVLWLSIAGIIYGGLTALAQQDMKKLIAYSSVGHMGFVTLGIFVMNTQGIEGAILQMINHGITTGALFLCVGMIYERTHSRELRSATGVGQAMPIFVTLVGFFSLSSFAFPGTNSFVGEFMILAGTFEHSVPLALAAIPGRCWRPPICCACCRRSSGAEWTTGPIVVDRL